MHKKSASQEAADFERIGSLVTQSTATNVNYKDYLRSQFVYQSFEELNLKRVHISKVVGDKPRAHLCELYFSEGHECLFGQYCLYAHSITDIQENDEEFRQHMAVMSTNKRSLFKNFGIWPTTIILSYFTPLEVIELSRVNKEAHYISKKVFETRKVELHKISLRLVKFFHRAHMIRISKDSV
jgi:hypothetical protein